MEHKNQKPGASCAGPRDGAFAGGHKGSHCGRQYRRLKSEIDFAAINRAALPYLPELVERWLPQGRRRGREWVALNPTRVDESPGSFKINLVTGRWADFASGACGGDLISLAAYLARISQSEAATRIAAMLGVRP